VLHSCNGLDVLNQGGVRIFITGENVTPDFNICDYALGFQRLSFGDRYCRLPLFRLYNKGAYECLWQVRPPLDAVWRAKTGFCAGVISNAKGDPVRLRIAELLSAYKRVDMGGSCGNNMGGPVADKHGFQARYKFALALENCSSPGYATEKIVDAFASQAIPIYWGDPEIAQDFNPESFINCHDFDSLEGVVERVMQIDRDDALCRRMLAAPCFRDGREPAQLQETYFRAFLANIFDQPWEQAFRRNRGYWGRKHERRLRDAWHRPVVQAIRRIQGLSRRAKLARNPYVWRPAPTPGLLPFRSEMAMPTEVRTTTGFAGKDDPSCM